MGLTDFILSYYGCPKVPVEGGCWGPTEQWWLLGLTLKQYPSMIIAAVFITLIIFAVILLVKHKNLDIKKIIKTGAISFIVSFILVYLLLIWMQMNTVY